MDKRVLGQIGENAAADVLRAKGYRILRQNYRCRYGEIDIIAEKYGEMSFIEVKTRTADDFGYPADAVDENKQRKIRRAADCYLAGRRVMWNNVSLDVMEVTSNLITDCI